MKYSSVVIWGTTLVGLLLWSAASAWGPYDSDPYGTGYGGSHRAGAATGSYPSPGYYGTPASPYHPGSAGGSGNTAWQADEDRQDRDWGASRWYTDEFELYRHGASPTYGWQQQRDAEVDGPSAASSTRYYAEERYEAPGADHTDRRPWSETSELQSHRSPDHRSSHPAPGGSPDDAHVGGTYWTEPSWSPWDQSSAGRRYRFRSDPKLDALGGDGQGGYRYRPLSEREMRRRERNVHLPQHRPEDLQPQGPRRSYQDAGSAFGYHPDYRFDPRYGRDRP